MARPPKVGIEFFPVQKEHDANLRSLVFVHGAKAGWAVICAKQEMCKVPNAEVDITPKSKQIGIAASAGLQLSEWLTIMADAAELGVIDKAAFEAGILTSADMKAHFDFVMNERKRKKKGRSDTSAEVMDVHNSGETKLETSVNGVTDGLPLSFYLYLDLDKGGVGEKGQIEIPPALATADIRNQWAAWVQARHDAGHKPLLHSQVTNILAAYARRPVQFLTDLKAATAGAWKNLYVQRPRGFDPELEAERLEERMRKQQEAI